MRLATVRRNGKEMAAVILPGGAVPVREVRDPGGWPPDLFSLLEGGVFHDLRRWWEGLSGDELEELSERAIPPAEISYAPLYRLRVAISLAKDTGAELHVVHVGPHYVYPPHTAGPTPPTGTDEELKQEAQGVLDWQVDEVEKAGGEVAEAHLRMGRPAEEILRLSEEVVVGNQGLGGGFSRMKRFLMGSVSEKVSRYARCSVMVVRRDLYDRPPA